MKKLSLFLVLLSFSSAANAEQQLKSLTIYGNSDAISNATYYNQNTIQTLDGSAIATYIKTENFSQGLNNITINNLPATIDETSINLNKFPLGKNLVEQYFVNNNLVTNSDEKNPLKNLKQVLVEQAIGEKIIERKGKIINSAANSASQISIEQEDGKIITINNPLAVTYLDAQDFKSSSLDKNSQIWVINSSNSEAGELEYSYKISAIGWSAEYRLELANNAQQTTSTLQAFASIYNYSDIDFKTKNLKLIAGQVNSVPSQNNFPRVALMEQAMAKSSAVQDAPSGFAQNNFSDLQTFIIDREVELQNKTLKKIKMFDDKPNIKVTRNYIVQSINGGNKIDVEINLLNKVENGLGQSLAAGKYKVYELDEATKTQEFIGEAKVGQVPVEQTAKITTGSPFNLTSERKIINQNYDSNTRKGFFEVEYKLSNKKPTDATFTVVETINQYNQQDNWQISGNNFPFEKTNANTAQWKIPVKSQKSEVLKFKVDYQW